MDPKPKFFDRTTTIVNKARGVLGGRRNLMTVTELKDRQMGLGVTALRL